MQRLILLRHAKSAYPPGVADHERPLNNRGRNNAATIAARMRTFIPAGARTVAVLSTATRVQQTWAIARQGLEVDSRSDRSLYLAEPDTLLETASIIEAEVGIIVGHNPGLEELACAISGAEAAKDPLTGENLVDKFPTSAFAVVDCANQTWQLSAMTCTGFAVCR